MPSQRIKRSLRALAKPYESVAAADALRARREHSVAVGRERQRVQRLRRAIQTMQDYWMMADA